MNDVQNCILNIYKEIKLICERHNINYYGTSGTCLGAIRHKGFIPWDDDLDMVIPIEEFDNFIEIAKKELPDYLEIYSPFERKHFPHLIIKIIDKRTTFIEKSFYKYEDAWSGIWVDVIPLCGVPRFKIAREIFYMRLWLMMYFDLYIREDYLGSHFTSIQKIIKKYILKHRDSNYYMNKQLNLIKKHPVKTARFVLEAGFFHFKNWTSKKEWFDQRKKVPFENSEIYIPGEYHNYLLNQFGDYMTIPSKEEQKIHAGFIDLNKSYKYYMQNPEIARGYLDKNDKQ